MAHVEDKDLGWKSIKRKMLQLDEKEVTAGVLPNSGNYDTGISIARVACINEYGVSTDNVNIPSRPFIAIATDSHRFWQKDIDAKIGGIIDRPAQGIESNLSELGVIMAADIRRVIGSSKLKRNALSTIRRKHHDMPLIGLTYKLMNSINYEVK